MTITNAILKAMTEKDLRKLFTQAINAGDALAAVRIEHKLNERFKQSIIGNKADKSTLIHRLR
jgi:hypothetical protein